MQSLRPNFEVLIWDLDGVVTDTSTMHMRAWIEALSREYGVTDAIGNQEYEEFFNGVPRYVGIKRFIDSRSKRLDNSLQDDSSIEKIATKLAADKCEIFRSYLKTEEVRVFEDSLSLIHQFRGIGVSSCLASQSQNAEEVIQKAGIDHLFLSVASGNTAKVSGVKSKPDPGFYRHASDLAGIPINRAIVFEDTYAGAYSSVSAGALCTIGVARQSSRYSELTSAGCDMVVRDLNGICSLLSAFNQNP